MEDHTTSALGQPSGGGGGGDHTHTHHDPPAIWEKVLKETFRVDGFRPLQREAVESLVLDRRDTVLVLPTGGGKRLVAFICQSYLPRF